MLNAGIAAAPTHDLASVTSAMNKAATQDLRDAGSSSPALAACCAGARRRARATQQMLDAAARRGAPHGSSRLDRDLDGKMDAGAAPAIMDAIYPQIADAVLAPVLGPQLGAALGARGRDEQPGGGFTGGRINYVDKDLRTLPGTQFKAPFKTRFCGGGDLAACRDSLWAGVRRRRRRLAAAQGTRDPAAWTSDANAERIKFAPGLLPTTIRYTNRPSGIQQVISFTGHRKTRR